VSFYLFYIKICIFIYTMDNLVKPSNENLIKLIKASRPVSSVS
jgi:hypothetical protein